MRHDHLGSVRQYRQENADLQSFEFVRGAMSAANVISAERGPTNDLLVRPQDDGAIEVRHLLAARVRSDQALDHFRGGIAQATVLDDRERSNLLHALDSVRITLADARTEVDALGMRPHATRGVHDIQHAQARLFRIVDTLSLLIDGAMTDTAMGDPRTSGRSCSRGSSAISANTRAARAAAHRADVRAAGARAHAVRGHHADARPHRAIARADRRLDRRAARRP